MKQYAVTGMACAACSARVEKAVSRVEGVSSCSVNLLTNSMGVEGDVPDSVIIQAVVDAGYGAHVMEQKKNGETETEDTLKDTETKTIDCFFNFTCIFDVFIHGTYDVGMAHAGCPWCEPCSDGTCSDVIDDCDYGH